MTATLTLDRDVTCDKKNSTEKLRKSFEKEGESIKAVIPS